MKTRKKLTLGLIIIILGYSPQITAATRVPTQTVSAAGSYEKEIETWRNERLEEVNGETGWNTLVGLFWLHEGQNRLGSSPSNEIMLPPDRAPRLAGVLLLHGATLELNANSNSGITYQGKPVHQLSLKSDAEGLPTTVKLGSLTMFVIKRGDRYGLRVKDKHHPDRLNFKGLSYFPLESHWRAEGKLERNASPKVIPIVNVLGMIEDMISPGTIEFNLNGKTFKLDPVIEKGSKQLFVIFADATNGKETYGAGRYLYVDPPDKDGRVTIDFNKAYNPPCAFTKFATCPLPPRQNRLSIKVEAGEKKYAGSEH